jgi:glutathione peroxidase-family protein
MASFSDFEMKAITGESVALSRFENQVCLAVNVASE